MPKSEAVLNTQSDEFLSLLNVYGKKDWQAITLEDALEYRGELPFFSPKWFLYYLPSWMLLCITHPYEVDTLFFNLISSLSTYKLEMEYYNISSRVDYTERIEIVANISSEAMCSVIIEFLYICIEIELSEKSLLLDNSLEAAIRFWSSKC